MKDHITEWLRGLLGPAYTWIRDYLFDPIYSLIAALWDPSVNLFFPYLVSATLIAFAVYRWQECGMDPRIAVKGFWRYLLPHDIFFHRSALLDYKFYFVNSFVTKLLFSGVALGSAVWLAGPVSSAIEHLLGPSPEWEITHAARATFTISIVLAIELGSYIGHYMEHRISLLWQFHKTHHSCEVLTPISTFRSHPMDDIVEGVTRSLTTGCVVGAFAYIYPSGIIGYAVMNISVVFLVSYLVANLLHSHIWLSYGWLNRVFVSPAMHQVHHSSERRHFDCNFANFFSFWDWIFGTLYLPRGQEKFSYGISNNEHLEFNSVWNLYIVPFKNAYRLLRGQTSAKQKPQESSSGI